MHVSELTRKFQSYVGKPYRLLPGQAMDGSAREAEIGDNGTPSVPDETCPHTRSTHRRITELAHKFNSEVIINGAPRKTNARCQVHVQTGYDLALGPDRITGIEARIV